MNENTFDYPTGPASLFSNHAREVEPVYEGQACIHCQGKENKLIYFGYDSEHGYMWIHPDCKEELRQLSEKYDREQAQQSARNPLYR